MIGLRQYQKDGLNALWSYFVDGGKGNPLLCWPTGTGKSLAPAIFIRDVLREYPTQRFMLLTHVSTLISQNYEVLTEIWPNAPVGIHSAGLKQRDVIQPIIYGGIQSTARLGAEAFGKRDLVFVDEAHLISQDDSSQYLKFITGLKIINPMLRVVGMTATPYRLGQGMITDGGLFTDICHDITGMDAFNQLITDGFLCPLIPHKTKAELDVGEVSIQKGEFNATELQGAVDKAEVTWRGLQELAHVFKTRKRRSCLLFASGIEHAEHIAAFMMQLGIPCAAVHSKQDNDYNDAAIKAFKSFELPAIVNYGKLTTGFNHPWIDIIGMFRPTLSVALWVQMLGRGTRPAQGKDNCLVMDFARNTERLGPINDPVIPNKKGDKKGDIPVKLCEICGAYNHISARVCCDCGEEFHFKVKITPKAGTHELIKQADSPLFNEYDVTYVIYDRRQKDGGKPFILVTYFCGFKKMFKEVVFPENHKYPKPFIDWWRQRHKVEPPKTTDECMMFISELRSPRKLRVHENKKPYPEILGVVW